MNAKRRWQEDGKEALISLEDGNLIKIEGRYWFDNLFVDNDGFIHFSDSKTKDKTKKEENWIQIKLESKLIKCIYLNFYCII